MFTFVQYRGEYETTLARLEAEYQRLTLQEKSQRVLGRDNPLLYSSRMVAAKMGGRGLSDRTVERQLDRQAPQFEGIAYHTLVCVPLRRIPLPEARWIFLDFTGQAGGWRYRRAEAVNKFCAAIAGKPPESACRFFSGGIATADLLDQMLLELCRDEQRLTQSSDEPTMKVAAESCPLSVGEKPVPQLGVVTMGC